MFERLKRRLSGVADPKVAERQCRAWFENLLMNLKGISGDQQSNALLWDPKYQSTFHAYLRDTCTKCLSVADRKAQKINLRRETVARIEEMITAEVYLSKSTADRQILTDRLFHKRTQEGNDKHFRYVEAFSAHAALITRQLAGTYFDDWRHGDWFVVLNYSARLVVRYRLNNTILAAKGDPLGAIVEAALNTFEQNYHQILDVVFEGGNYDVNPADYEEKPTVDSKAAEPSPQPIPLQEAKALFQGYPPGIIKPGDIAKLRGAHVLREDGKPVVARFIKKSGDHTFVGTINECQSVQRYGFFPDSDFDIEARAHFDRASDILSACQIAQKPKDSFLVPISRIELLPARCLSMFNDATSDGQLDGHVTVGNLHTRGDCKLIDATEMSITIQAGAHCRLTELLRADLDGDGLEDVLVWQEYFDCRSRYRSSSIVLTRLGRTKLFSVVSPPFCGEQPPSWKSAGP